MQNHYNLVYREEEREMIPLCRAEGIGLIPWSPLARGFLAGNRKADGKTGETTRAKSDEFAQSLYFQPDDFAVAEKVKEVAAKRGVKPIQVALAWVRDPPRRHRPHHRRHQARPPRRRLRRPGDHPRCGRGESPGSALSAPCGAGA